MSRMEELIIKSDDPRYNHLDYLWTIYNYDNLITDRSFRSWRYLVPEELILTDKLGTNIGCKNLSKFLKLNCNLTTQDYFDLLVLHINNRLDRPKCSLDGCMNYLKFISFSQGYGSLGNWNPDANHYCCNEHQRLDHESANKSVLNSEISSIKRQRSTFLSKAKGSVAHLYITELKTGGIKYGITEDLSSRVKSMNYGSLYINPRIVFTSSTEEVANLEARLKLRFSGNEYLNESDLIELTNLINSELVIRPITNPFD